MASNETTNALLAAVTDQWERGKDIAQRAGVGARTVGPRLAAIYDAGRGDVSKPQIDRRWTQEFGGVYLYRKVA
jgi:hypothetical protein